ncbi:MAG: hypothetical protein [Caudoviricetes sp.]|nr:MAG: hypothetical protein [Caudoviricetes sp.]
MIQDTKKRIDTGSPDQPDSGDTIHVGGNKINESIDNLYNAFGDYRQYINPNGTLGVGSMFIHATGYYQKMTNQYYASNIIDIGSMHDIDTTTGPVKVRLPATPTTRKRGELIKIVNSSGSVSPNNPIIIETTGNDRIDEQSSLTLTEPFTEAILWVTNDSVGTGEWKFRTQSMIGQNAAPPMLTQAITGKNEVSIPLFDIASYTSAKLMILAVDTTLNSKHKEICETLLLVKDGQVLSTEYGRIKDEDYTIFETKYAVVGSKVVMKVKGVDTTSAKITIKTVETMKEGV